jgi:heme exporter protein C
MARSKTPYALIGLGATLLIWGSVWGLFVAPAETFMGDVQRIMYVHVPTAWNAMLGLTFAFFCALAYLTWGEMAWDNRLEATIEVSVVLSGLLCLQGAIWAKPTWGVWWDWDPRLTTTAVMVFTFGAILALRQSSPATVSRAFHWPLRINAFGVLFLMLGYMFLRTRVAALRRAEELAPPLPETASRRSPVAEGARS